MTAKGYRTLAFLKQNLWVNSPMLKARVNASILRPHLEYCSTVWDPCKMRGKQWFLQFGNGAATGRQMGTGEIPAISKRARDAYRAQLENPRADKSRRAPNFNNLVAVNSGENLRSPTRKSSYVHDHSFIPISSSATSHRLSFFHLPTSRCQLPTPRCLISPLILLSSGPVCLEYSNSPRIRTWVLRTC